jgi:CRISPR/Cas system CSM-associated protein Csm5 (group 7 of RAMP superfamily)
MGDLGKTIIKGKLRIVTPVHIGGAQEKHLQRGLDYIDNYDGVYFLDEKKLIDHFDIIKYSDALAQGKLGELCGSLNISEYSTKVIKNISGEIGTDIKTSVKNTLSGKPIIPGSSLKGSLRSVFYNFIVGDQPPEREDLVFGKIAEDIFRYMIVNDVEFSGTSYINTKTFNLRNDRGQFAGGWKHELKGNTTNQFNSRGFTFPHEVINTEDIGDFSIVINTQALSLAIKEQTFIEESNRNLPDGARRKQNILKYNKFSDQVFNGSESNIYDLLQKYMSTYIQKEIDFFSKYETDQSGLIIDELKQLLELNKQAPLLRLGLGSGFHAMTGDTLHDSHEIDGIGNRNRGLHNGYDSAKSRKIAFKGSGENLRLFPMGFVQLCSEDFYAKNYKEAFELKIASAKDAEIKAIEKMKADTAAHGAAKIKAAEAENKAKEEAEMAKLEALKPKMTDPSALKKAKFVDAIVVGQKGKMVQFKPYVIGFEDKVFEIGYAAGFEVDTIIQVLCSSNGKTIVPTGSPNVKK